MSPEGGQLYWRKGDRFKAVVAEILSLDGEWVTYRVIHGPKGQVRKPQLRCKLKNFIDWQACERAADYGHLDGCKPLREYLVLGVTGEPLFRCTERRANYYRKRLAVQEIEDGVLQFTDDAVEKRLRSLHPNDFSPFFLAAKADRCCVCGATTPLTRHHVIPTRHKPNVPRPWRSCLSNILYVCWGCHARYEQHPEPVVAVEVGWPHFAHAWRDHFLKVMTPAFLPDGWDIVCIQNPEDLKTKGTKKVTKDSQKS
ncbi:MAG TPA: hypothetical protein VMZ71_04275 [Gemmataceae bacterium]|nr:hypothetical protein [Gemmataceae bacterium]